MNLTAGATHTHACMGEVIRVAIGIDELGGMVGETDVGDAIGGGGEGVAAHTVRRRAAKRAPLGRRSWRSRGANNGGVGGDGGRVGGRYVGGSINEGEGGAANIPSNTCRHAERVAVVVAVADRAGEGGMGGVGSLTGVASHGSNSTADMEAVATRKVDPLMGVRRLSRAIAGLRSGRWGTRAHTTGM